jgi:hypothetical protein
MARKDEILKSFFKHELFEAKYELTQENLPSTVRDALNSSIPIVKAIALIVEALDGTISVTDNALRNQVTQYLNEAL